MKKEDKKNELKKTKKIEFEKKENERKEWNIPDGVFESICAYTGC